MPTGYAATLVEKGQTFQEFALTCARAFGACIEMREEPLDVPIPDEFTSSALTYHQGRIASAKEELQRLAAMTPEQQLAFGEGRKREEVRLAENYLAKNRAENERLMNMRAKVEAWTPPTDNHQGVKVFMLEQIGLSLNDCQYAADRLKQAEAADPMGIYTSALEVAKRDIAYHTKEASTDQERAVGRTQWVRDLRASLQDQ